MELIGHQRSPPHQLTRDKIINGEVHDVHVVWRNEISIEASSDCSDTGELPARVWCSTPLRPPSTRILNYQITFWIRRYHSVASDSEHRRCGAVDIEILG